MKILLDTNVLLWFIKDDDQLSIKYKEIIEKPENEIYVSIVSLWEITIKFSIGKLELDIELENFFKIITDYYDFKILSMNETHLLEYLKLPLFHRDPFDRILYSQAKIEQLTFLYTDEIFKIYDQKQ
ncbi:MAG: type II toxin-antitoxin system VapC family toxin [Desulfobacterales bacterium]|nr:type II toxin-antitoxin system VapC family toxin [Desulfobacterales bacterium]